jgi:hypothetical protein
MLSKAIGLKSRAPRTGRLSDLLNKGSPVATVIESLLRGPMRISAPGDCNHALRQSSGALLKVQPVTGPNITAEASNGGSYVCGSAVLSQFLDQLNRCTATGIHRTQKCAGP